MVRPFFPEVNVDAICGFSDVQEEASTEREVRSILKQGYQYFQRLPIISQAANDIKGY